MTATTMMTPMMMSWLALGMPAWTQPLFSTDMIRQPIKVPEHSPLASAQAAAADHHGGDDLQLQARRPWSGRRWRPG